MSVVEHRPTTPERPAGELRTVAETVGRLAGDYLRGAFRGAMTVAHKRDRHDLVTEHDRAAEDLVVARLLAECPDWRVVGEEAGVRGGDSAVTWYVDPIDGTSNFAQGLAFFCVALGVEIDGKMVAGVVYDPMADEMFSADGAAAYLNGDVLVTPVAQPGGAATLITGYPTAADLAADGPDALADFGALVESFSSVRRTGSGALTLAHVAAGRTDAAFGSSVHPWDVAGAALIVRQAGGSYRPVWLNGGGNGRPDHFAPAFVAAGPGARYPVLDTVVEHIRRRRS